MNPNGLGIFLSLEGLVYVFDLDGLLANPVAEIVELGATHFACRNNLDLGDTWAVERVNTLHSGAVGNLANSEGLVDSGAADGKHDALEHLDALLTAFDHPIVDLYGVTDAEV